MSVRGSHLLRTLLVAYCLGAVAAGRAALTVLTQEVTLVRGESETLQFYLRGHIDEPANVSLSSPVDNDVLEPFNETWVVPFYDVDEVVNVTITTVQEGKVTLQATSTSVEIDTTEAFVVLSVMRNPAFETAAMVLGWGSTVAWDVSFLPQIWHNYRRHSVVGLSFDFLAYNFIGFTCYLLFNIGLFWIPGVQAEFRLRHPNEILHVRLNDVVFPLYAVLCTAVIIVQCILYPRAPGQRVSLTCRLVSTLLVLLVLVSCVLVPFLDQVMWLDVFYLMSFVKLFISTIKYTPQLYTNFKAKSTEGWSIGQVILDFTGGVLSLVQMFLIAANYDDYKSVLSDPTKLGLGLLSIFFNIFFFIQHYCLYKDNVNTSNTSSEDVHKKQHKGDENTVV